MSEMDTLFSNFGTLLKTVLPLSPFKEFYESFAVPTWVGWINWFFPVGTIVRIMLAWVTAYAVYQLYSIILRWIKAIQ